jgi:hypothetical protein
MKREFDRVSAGWVIGVDFSIGDYSMRRYLRCTASDEFRTFKYGKINNWIVDHPLYLNTLTVWLFKRYLQVWW